MTRVLVAMAVLAALAAPARAGGVSPEVAISASVPRARILDRVSDNGRHIVVEWRAPGAPGGLVLIARTTSASADAAALGTLTGTAPAVKSQVGEWTIVALAAAEDDPRFIDDVTPGHAYRYAALALRTADDGRVVGLSAPAVSAPIQPEAAFFDIDRWFFLAIIALMAVLLLATMQRVRARPDDVFIRRIPGVDAIEESVGRSTEMGRPVLYVTGVEEIQSIQTIASLLILGRVAELTAEYDSEIKVANAYPLTMVVAEEIVKQGFANAGRIDAHKPDNVLFISSEQFAFAAGVNGIILRDQPATNIYLGRFFAESLMLAETGHVTGSIQIAGTAEITQLPFFIAACDYTVIGEELYAVSAYLSREPVLLATLKSSDMVKLVIMILVLVGALGATAGWFHLGPWLVP